MVETVNGNIEELLRRGRGYSDLNYLLLKAQRLAVTKTHAWLHHSTFGGVTLCGKWRHWQEPCGILKKRRTILHGATFVQTLVSPAAAGDVSSGCDEYATVTQP